MEDVLWNAMMELTLTPEPVPVDVERAVRTIITPTVRDHGILAGCLMI